MFLFGCYFATMFTFLHVPIIFPISQGYKPGPHVPESLLPPSFLLPPPPPSMVLDKEHDLPITYTV